MTQLTVETREMHPQTVDLRTTESSLLRGFVKHFEAYYFTHPPHPFATLPIQGRDKRKESRIQNRGNQKEVKRYNKILADEKV